jgi:hypothetical protein
MPLPKIEKPLFELKVPSQNRSVLCRPFVVREEKILLTAQQSRNEKDIVLAIKQVLENCIEDPTFDADEMTTYDLEYMFLKLRSRSVNNVIEVSYRDHEDDKVYKFEIDLDEVEMLEDKEINNKIMITDDIGMIMKFPSVTVLSQIPSDVDSTQLIEHLILACIDQIFDENDVYPAHEQDEKELKEFVDNLDVDTFDKLREFFDSIPSLYHKLEYENSLGNKRSIELTTLSDFFTWG